MRDLVRAVAMSLLPGGIRFGAVSHLREAWSDKRLAIDASATETIALLVSDARLDASCESVVSRAHRVLERAAAAGVAAVPFTDPAYPSLLGRLSDAPAVLWVLGQAAVLDATAVAIVGARAATAAGVHAGRRLAEDLAAAGVVIVSGLARGIDAAAHEGALVTGNTVAVLGSGVDVIYPAEHAALAKRVAGSGAVVSEFAPGTAPRQHHFPLRNRIISGLSLAVIVVEAGERSGALITARTALDQGRDVMAVPGPVAGGRNRGAHGLIRDGALLVETAEDVLSALGAWRGPGRDPGVAVEPQDAVLQELAPGEVVDLDALALRMGLDGQTVMARVSQLEVEGWVQRVPGGRILRLSRKW